jgi:hypothetical protein
LAYFYGIPYRVSETTEIAVCEIGGHQFSVYFVGNVLFFFEILLEAFCFEIWG